MTAYDPAAYWQAVEAEDTRLHGTLAAIRTDEAAGHLTVREAADNRIAVMEAHLAACRAHARTFLGDPEPEVPGPGLETPEPGDPGEDWRAGHPHEHTSGYLPHEHIDNDTLGVLVGADDDGTGLERVVRHALAAQAAEVQPVADEAALREAIERDQRRPLQQPQHSAEWVREAFPAWSVVLEDGHTWLAQRMDGSGPQLRAATLGLLVETISDWLDRERAAAEQLAAGAPPIPEDRKRRLAHLLPPVAAPGDARRFWG